MKNWMSEVVSKHSGVDLAEGEGCQRGVGGDYEAELEGDEHSEHLVDCSLRRRREVLARPSSSRARERCMRSVMI
jgi:hypothetical protein